MMPVGGLDRPRRGTSRRSSAEKRQSIMWAALELFIDTGYERTRIGDICSASGFSVGSIYHFFGSKAEIAAELCAFGARSWAEAVAKPLRSAPTAEAAVRDYVRAFFAWVAAHPELYNFMNDHRVEAASSAAMAEIARAQAALEEMMAARLIREAEAGRIRRLPMPVYRAVIDGPCIAYLLWWARNRGDMGEMADRTAAAAWDALVHDGTPDTACPDPIGDQRPPSSEVETPLVERMWRAGAGGAETRERILAVALGCFRELGFERTSVLDIARRAEIAVGTIYHHFGSKEGIAAAWCAEGWGDWYRTFVRVIEDEKSPRAMVRAVVRAMFRWVEVNVDIYTFVYDQRRVATARSRVDLFEAGRSNVIRHLERAIAGPIARGELRAMPAEVLMVVATGMCLGYLVPWSVRRDDWGDAPEMVAEAAWRAVRGGAAPGMASASPGRRPARPIR